jgi:hypothetical protein
MWAQARIYISSRLVDLAHQGHLMVLFLNAPLIDTYWMDPEVALCRPSNGGLLLQNIFKVFPNSHRLPVGRDNGHRASRAPSVRDGNIRRRSVDCPA